MAAVSGGQRLEAELQKIAAGLKRGATLRVGFLEKARYPDGKSVAMVAAVDEFGAPSRGQPPRPAIRNMIAAKKGEWPGAIAGLLRDNGYDAEKALSLAGAAIAGQMRESIATITSPPLKPATIKKKGFDKPWIETSHLINSVSHEVKAS